jgi:hypothetical protein
MPGQETRRQKGVGRPQILGSRGQPNSTTPRTQANTWGTPASGATQQRVRRLCRNRSLKFTRDRFEAHDFFLTLDTTPGFILQTWRSAFTSVRQQSWPVSVWTRSASNKNSNSSRVWVAARADIACSTESRFAMRIRIATEEHKVAVFDIQTPKTILIPSPLEKANATAFRTKRSWLRGADLNRRPLGYAI